jgi:soluble cytochrome b562
VLSEEKRDLLFSLKLPKIDNKEDSFAVCKVKLEYLNVIEMNNESIEITSTIKRVSEYSNDFSVSIELDKQRNRIISADAIDKARKLADNGKLDEAKTVIVQVVEVIKKSVSKDLEFCQNLVDDLLSCKDTLKSKEEYISTGNKYVKKIIL